MWLLACGEDARPIGAVRSKLGADVLESLRALPGVANVSEGARGTGGVRSFTFTVEQPLDHTQPTLGSFTMRVQLRHRSETAPTVLSSTGYALFSAAASDSEPSYLLNGNAVSVEHRFFGPSTPLSGSSREPSVESWKYVTVRQAAADNHHIVELLKQIYTGPWLSTGASKGGQASIFHYRFYPEDLVGVVAYVAPQSYGSDDPRYVDFMEYVGDASCRDKVLAVQRSALMRRSELFPLFQSQANGQGLTFEAIGIEPAFEHLVQEFRIAFWQYGTTADCSRLPQPAAAAASLLRAITDRVPLNLSSDQNLRSVRSFETYYYQAAVELGQYGPMEQHLEDLIQHPGTYTMDRYAPQVPSKVWNPATMIDIGEWVKTKAEHILFVYGENDPWTAGAFEFDPARDIHGFVVPGGNHGSSLTARSLPPESLELAYDVLERWTGVAPRRVELAALERNESAHDLFVHAPAPGGRP
ncbi:MAG TPA: S28 family serine protease [Polyangiales bacterium]|nr:S28 family serine protease [Polyangiales bacterium]